jgi:hypothetical protein
MQDDGIIPFKVYIIECWFWYETARGRKNEFSAWKSYCQEEVKKDQVLKIAKCLAGSEDLFLISYKPETEHIEDNKRHQIFNDDDNRVSIILTVGWM